MVKHHCDLDFISTSHALKDFERQKKEKGTGKTAIYRPDPKEIPTATFWLEDYPKRLKEEDIQP